MREDIYASSNHEIAVMLGRRFQNYRKRMKLTQKQLAELTGISVFTISAFEKGMGTGLSLTSFIGMMRAIDQLEQLDALLPELPESPRDLFEKQMKQKKQ
jgi:DNA-binding helix-turn-helix protein